MPRAPSTSPLSREMAGHLALLDAPALSPLASPASAGSDVSEASGERRLPPEVAIDLDAPAQPHSSSTSRQARPPSTAGKPASSSMQGAGGPADEEGRPHGDQPKKRALEEGLAESEHKRQRCEQDAVDVSHGRCAQLGGPRLILYFDQLYSYCAAPPCMLKTVQAVLQPCCDRNCWGKATDMHLPCGQEPTQEG